MSAQDLIFFPFNLWLSINIDCLNSSFALVEQYGLLAHLSPPVPTLLINAKKGLF